MKIFLKYPYFFIGASISILSISHVFSQKIIRETIQELKSPDEKFVFIFYQTTDHQNKNQLKYKMLYNDKEVIKESELGVLINNKLFESALAIENDATDVWCENMQFMGVKTNSVDTSWIPLYGEKNIVYDRYHEMTIHFEKFNKNGKAEEKGFAGTAYDRSKNYEMDLTVRAYDHAIAFRYHFPETKNGLFMHITGEQTNFTMPEGTMAFYERWAQGPYHYLPLKGWPDECERPLTMKLKNGLYVSLLEAQMVDYSRGKFRLSNEKENCIEISLYDKVDVITPYSSPWRVVMAGNSAIQLLENNDVVLNLNEENKISNTSWIKPGKVFRSRLSMKESLESVDFASDHNIQYVHLDAGWYGPDFKLATDATTVAGSLDLNVQELVNYASSKNIGIILYVDQRALSKQLDVILPLYHDWGIKGLKFGFVQVGSNRWTTWMHEAVRKAAEHQLLVNVHDEYRPTGFSRTYPNLMTQEGVRGNEEMPDAEHNTILPFTRFLTGAADYTICYYSNRIKTTHAHQLALSVIYYSPLQYLFWYDTPAQYQGEKEIEFFEKVKTVWDDTRIINGEIGEYISIARRSGNEWFVGSITNTKTREISIPLTFLTEKKKYIMKVYEDDDALKSRTNVRISEYIVTSENTIQTVLIPSGGVALHFEMAKDSDLLKTKEYNQKKSDHE